MCDINNNIGIFGGTFDPIHYGHLIIGEEIRDKFELNKVIFIPSGTPPHKNMQNVSDVEHRYSMVQNAILSNPFFEVSRIEIDRQGYSYTIDTLNELKKNYGEDVNFSFIIGADTVFDLKNWKSFKELFYKCEFIAALRPGYKKETFINEINHLEDKYFAKIKIAEIPLIEISSTDIRNRCISKRSIKYIVPPSVEEYILKNKLY